MKELSIKEKAQRYDEAIKKAEALYKAAEPMSGCNVIIETLFPELREPEDERIRKWLIYYFKEVCDNVSEKEKKGILAWLEKQGEQKPAAKVEPTFEVGDKIQYLKGCGTIMTIEKIENDEYVFANGMGHTTIESGNKWHLVEQKPDNDLQKGEDYGIDGLWEISFSWWKKSIVIELCRKDWNKTTKK